jgi:membrane-associated phospholipid phosphatase
MKLEQYHRRILFSLLILSIILCGISFIIPTAEIASVDGTSTTTFFLWGGQYNNNVNNQNQQSSIYPFLGGSQYNNDVNISPQQLFSYPSMIGYYSQLASNVPAGDWFNYFKTLMIGYIFLTLTLLLFVLSLIFGIKGLFHMYRGDIKKELSWVFSSGVTAMLAILLYFVIMSFLILPSSIPSSLSGTLIYYKTNLHESWGVGFYLFLFGGLILTCIGSRKYIKQINEELKKEIPEDAKTGGHGDAVYEEKTIAAAGEPDSTGYKIQQPIQPQRGTSIGQPSRQSHTKTIAVVAIIVAVIIITASLVLFMTGDTHKFVGTWVGTESGSTTFLFFNLPWTKQYTLQFKSDGTVIINQETTTITGTYKINDGTLTLNLHGQSGLCSYSFSNNDRTLMLIPLSSSGSTMTLYKQ